MLLPWQTTVANPGLPLDDLVGTIFSQNVRFIGAGAIAVASIWTLLKLVKPIAVGLSGIAATSRARKEGSALDITERDLPGSVVLGTTAIALLPIAWLLWRFVQGGPVADIFPLALAATLIFILVVGAVVAAVTGYMAGLVGTSNSPVSGVGILSILVAAVMVALLLPGQHSPEDTKALVAYALFATAFVFGIAIVANDNLQDLKTGYLVGSTPWKQQVALVLGVAAGSLVVPPVLNLLSATMGFAGMPGAGTRCTGCAAGLADLEPRAGRARRDAALGPDRDWGRDNRSHHRYRRVAGRPRQPGRRERAYACHRWAWRWACISRSRSSCPRRSAR